MTSHAIDTTDDLTYLLEEAIKPALCRFSTQQDYVQAVLDVKEIITDLKKKGRCNLERVPN